MLIELDSDNVVFEFGLAHFNKMFLFTIFVYLPVQYSTFFRYINFSVFNGHWDQLFLFGRGSRLNKNLGTTKNKTYFSFRDSF